MSAVEFLNAIWSRQGEGFAELRLISNDGKVGQSWYAYPSDLDKFILSSISNRGPVTNVFAGVLLRDEQSGKAEHCKTNTPILWADFDTKKTSRLHVFHEINQIEIPPQIIVDSGHGFHTYWLLDKNTPVSEAQPVMKAIANRHGGDVVGDPARVMRVPGTTNVKGDPKPVRIVKLNPFERVRFSDFINYVPEEIELSTAEWHGSQLLPVSSYIEKQLQGDPWQGTRSEYIFGIICSMVRAGWSLEQVYEALIEAPAGEKIRELSVESGFRWVKTSYKNAMEAIALES